MTDRNLLLAATAYAATAAYGGVVSLRHDVPDEAVGVHWPDRVPLTLAAGLGSGTSAPWPMPLATLVAARRADGDAEWPAKVFTAIGWATIFGTLAEPATWGTHGHSRDLTAASALHLLMGAALVAAGHRAGHHSERGLPVAF